MRSFKYTLFGFFCFFLTCAFNVSLGILVYISIKEKSNFSIAIFVLLVIILSASICTIIDFYRRKIMIETPLKQILEATEKMARGNFKVRLIPNHSYPDYDEFDLIKDDLNKMASELSKSEVLKNDFVANVSHELKSPLNVIQNYALALKDDKISKQEKENYLTNLQQTCTKLSKLVTNILNLNKLENQKLIPEISCFDLSEILINQILQHEDAIDGKSIDLECNIEEKLMINSQASYLELIFHNLISNAIKFSNDNGKIYISLKKINDEYIFTIKDNGCGMDSKTGKHIFDKFYQGDTSHSKEGNGLGLALVKRVIDILGGNISVESELNVGTTFIVIIKEV